MATDSDDRVLPTDDIEDADFEALGRRAGAALCRPAPDKGVAEITRQAHRRRTIQVAAAGAVIIAVVGGGVALFAGGRDDTIAPVDTLPFRPPPSSAVEPDPDSDPVTRVSVSWTGTGDTVTPMELVDQATMPSSIGDLDWTVLRSESGGRATMPIRIAQGYISVQDGQLMLSDDAASWRAVGASFPGQPLGVSRVDADRFALTVRTPEGSLQYWTSSDLETWTLMMDDSKSTAFADVADGPGILHVERGYPSTALPNGDELAPLSLGLDLRGRLVRQVATDDIRPLFDQYGSEIWWEPDATGLSGIAGVAAITTNSWESWEDAKAQSVAAAELAVSITGSPDNWVVEVDDPGTGESLGTAQGSIGTSDLASTIEALVYGSFDAWFVLGEGTAERVQPDWADELGSDDLAFVTTDDGLLAYVGIGPNGGEVPPEIWRTTDGRSWERPGAAQGWPESEVASSTIMAVPDGRLLAALYDPQGALQLLTSDDGVDWQAAAQPPVLGRTAQIDSLLGATARGFVLVAESGGPEAPGFEMWTSPDGDRWERVEGAGVIVDDPAFDLTYSGQRGTGFSFGGTLFSRSYDEGPTVSWLIAVAP